MKWSRIVALPVLMLLFLSGCAGPLEGTEDETHKQIEKRCQEITSLYQDLYSGADKKEPNSRWEDSALSQKDIEAIEERLLSSGLTVMRTNGDDPEYLAAGDGFCGFLDSVRREESASQEVLAIRSSGELDYRLFTYRDGKLFVYGMIAPLEDGTDPDYEAHEVLDWELTDRGNFYYRIHPLGDKHFAGYSLIRLEKPDPELCALTRKYISAGGYVGSNLFLINWTEEDFSRLCFNDLWEYLYRYEHGSQFFPEGYEYNTEKHGFMIPAHEFEKVILPHFDIDTQTLRSLAQYDPVRDAYPWRQIESNDYAFHLRYYTMEPEAVSYTANEDGTITITVQVLSTDLKTDCLFSHEVTIRPQENGEFQFVGNQVLSQTEHGLPYAEPRLTWEAAG